MKAPIKSFEIIKEMYEYFVKKYRDLEPKLMICEKEDFDSVIYPSLEHVPPRYAISHRNRWMIEQADIVVCYVSHQYGGAYAMYADAKRKGKRIHNLGSLK